MSTVNLDEAIVMRENFLKQLNQAMDKVIGEKEELNIDYDLLEQALGYMLKNCTSVKTSPISVITPLEKSEMLGVTLDFFKSIDLSVYRQAIETILQQHENIKMKIYNIHEVKDFNKKDEFNLLEYTSDGSVQSNKGNAVVNVPTKVKVNSKEEKILDENECTLEDLYTVVHEISHLFDLDLESEKTSNEELKGKRPESKVSNTRELLGEATTIAFEGMLTDYLLKNTDYSKQTIEEISSIRINSFMQDARLVYAKLLLAKEKSKNGEITLQYIEKFMRDNNFSTQYVRRMARNIIDDPRGMNFEKRYALGGLIAPTIIKKYKEDGPSILKKYLEESKNGNFKGAMNTLGIQLNSEGLKVLVNNLKEQILDLSKEER